MQISGCAWIPILSATNAEQFVSPRSTAPRLESPEIANWPRGAIPCPFPYICAVARGSFRRGRYVLPHRGEFVDRRTEPIQLRQFVRNSCSLLPRLRRLVPDLAERFSGCKQARSHGSHRNPKDVRKFNIAETFHFA